MTEYAWNADSCDPCPGEVQGLTMDDLASLGADVLPSAKRGVPVADADERPRGVVTIGTATSSGAIVQNETTRLAAGARARARACYEQGLRSDPDMSGRLTMKLEVDASGAVTVATATSNSGLSAGVAACVERVFMRIAFSAGKGTATFPLLFTSTPPAKAAQPPKEALLSIGAGFVLTRLHARYARGALADDLVFKAAGKITGGRENRNAARVLETGAVSASENAFQARYAIRHAWTGPIACEKPVREIWGGPWPDAGVRDPGPTAATKLAYAPRGGVTLASFVPKGIPELAAIGAAPPAPPVAAPPESNATTSSAAPDADADGGAAPAQRTSRCGCDVIGGERGDLRVVCGCLAAIALAITARRRRGLACRSYGALRRARGDAPSASWPARRTSR